MQDGERAVEPCVALPARALSMILTSRCVLIFECPPKLDRLLAAITHAVDECTRVYVTSVRKHVTGQVAVTDQCCHDSLQTARL